MAALAEAPQPNQPLLEVHGISKQFAGVAALRDVSLDVRPGEILGLLGENGAGKSTLLKILSGAQPPSSGTITFDGADYRPSSPDAAKRAGIVTIYQELSLIPTLTVAENIFIGRAPIGRFGLVSWRRMERESREIIARVGLKIDPRTAAELGLDLLGQLLGHRRDLARRLAAGDDHIVGDAALARERDRDGFHGLIVVERGQDELVQSLGLVRGTLGLGTRRNMGRCVQVCSWRPETRVR